MKTLLLCLLTIISVNSSILRRSSPEIGTKNINETKTVRKSFGAISMGVNKLPKGHNGSIADFWTPERVQEALNNPLHEKWVINETHPTRTKRGNGEVDVFPIVDDEYFRKLGIKFDTKRVMTLNYQPSVIKRGAVMEEPFSPYGKLLYSTPRGRSHCTAQLVGHSGIILTAAHCVKNAGGLYEGWIFYQHYDGPDNVGVKRVVDKVFTKKEYEKFEESPVYGDLRYDYAFLTLTPESWGKEYLDITYGGPTPGNIISAGYPINAYQGELFVYTMGDYSGANEFAGMPTNAMTGGSSGGAWLQGTKGNRKVVGLNSFKYGNQLGMYSPILSDETADLFEKAKQLVENGDGPDSDDPDSDKPFPPIGQNGCSFIGCVFRCAVCRCGVEDYECNDGVEVCTCGNEL